MDKNPISIFWFRRDLRLEDNTGLSRALEGGLKVLPIFIFDQAILRELPKNDARVQFIYENLVRIHNELKAKGASLLILEGEPEEVWNLVLSKWHVKKVFINKDYEPYAIRRDTAIEGLLKNKGIDLIRSKDQVIFEEHEVMKKDGSPYRKFSPYKRAWLQRLDQSEILISQPLMENFLALDQDLPPLSNFGFHPSSIKVNEADLSVVENYEKTRNYPSLDGTSRLGPHLRFGTLSIRQLVRDIGQPESTFVSELIWREFFQQILFHYPHVVHDNFNSRYNRIEWRNDPEEFELWKKGMTGFPMVDAGIREMLATGYMHNRVRMVVAGFLCKHLLIDWRWGEAFFALKLLDYELASNNGNWQWVAGTGCDSVPYFRIFNPDSQLKKFDKNLDYVKKWIPELGTSRYPKPMVEHTEARNRALMTYKKALDLES